MEWARADASGSRLLDMALEDGAQRSPLSGLFPANLPLPSLEDALMPHSATLPHLHPSTGRSVKMARKQAKRAQAKHPDVTLDECTAIVLYTMEEIPRETSLYYVLNLALRNKVRAAVRPWRDYIWLLLHALRKLPPSTEVTVFRGCKKSPVDLGLELTKDFEFTWSSFSSTATTQGVMQTFVGQSGPRTLMTIKMAENSGRDVRDFSLYPGENEILFPPNMCFEVVDSFDAGNQLIMVQCRQTETVDVILDLNSAGKIGDMVALFIDSAREKVGSLFGINPMVTEREGATTENAPASKPTPQPPASPSKPTPQPPAHRFKLNERVDCRDRGHSWQVGTVVSVAPLKVKPDGAAWTAGYAWDEVRVLSAEVAASGAPKSSVMERDKPPPQQRARASAAREAEEAPVKNFRGPCAAYCKPLAPCCCVSADGEAIFGCVLTDRNYFLPACLHMALCPQLGCDPRGGDETLDYCCGPLIYTLCWTPCLLCVQAPGALVRPEGYGQTQ